MVGKNKAITIYSTERSQQSRKLKGTLHLQLVSLPRFDVDTPKNSLLRF